MPRLARKNIKVFAGSATNNGVFGSLQANNPTITSDVEQLQSLSAWGEGWNAATETSEELPPLVDLLRVAYVTTYQQAYIMQEGVPEWAATVTYYKGCLTKEVTSTGFRIYNSLTDNNTGNLLSDTSNWKKVMDSDDLYAFESTVVHDTGNETVAGTKTFSSSPLVPTTGVDDNSTKAASTAYVHNILSTIYPIGSIYIGTQETCPLASLISGSTWVLVATDRALWGGNGSNANTTIEAGLPDHYHKMRVRVDVYDGYQGIWRGGSDDLGYAYENTNNASETNPIYGRSDTVQPPAYIVNVWRRIA